MKGSFIRISIMDGGEPQTIKGNSLMGKNQGGEFINSWAEMGQKKHSFMRDTGNKIGFMALAH